ncbi:MAG: hypothetical protein M1817_002003 [Caeruleum heppii]|nr:MAG: hypothetical protein M1817_002003 [Caeruleum heppii]
MHHPQIFHGQTPQPIPQQAFYGVPGAPQFAPNHQPYPYAGEVPAGMAMGMVGGMPMAMGIPNGGVPPSGPMMHAGMQQQQHQHHQHQQQQLHQQQQHNQMAAHHNQYGNAGYAQAIHTPTTTPMQAHPQAAFHPPATVSPAKRNSPHGPPQGPPPPGPSHHPSQQQSHPSQQQQPPRHMPNSAPAQPQSGPSSTPSDNGPPGGRPNQQPPLSPASREQEKERITLLLTINGELLQETVKLREQGKAGTPAPTPGPKGDGKEDKDVADGEISPVKKPPQPEFIDCMRRLQANLAYLAAIADRSHKPASHIPPAPAIMSPPENRPALAELYKKLAALFPGVAINSRAGSAQPKAGGSDKSVTTSPKHASTTSKEGSSEAENKYKQWLEEMGGPAAQADKAKATGNRPAPKAGS